MNQLLKAPKISVIIPVKNAANTIGECLDAIYTNNNADFEVMVVDDGCTDDTIDIALRYNCSILKNNFRKGVSGARNSGAHASRADVLLFIDSDIVVSKNTLSKISEKIRYTDAVVGMLNENIRFNNFSSQYKNLWMHNTFNNLAESISLIFSSVAAIKRDIFLKCGGFDINYSYPNVEDNELGIRLRKFGHNITLDKTLQVEHLKRYCLLGLLKTHYFRAKGLIKLYNRERLHGLSKNNPSSVPNAYLFNIPLTIAAVWLLLSLPFGGSLPLKMTIAVLLPALFIFVNYKWLYFLNKKRGVFFTVRSLFYLPVEFIVIILGLAVGQIEYFMGRRY